MVQHCYNPIVFGGEKKQDRIAASKDKVDLQRRWAASKTKDSNTIAQLKTHLSTLAPPHVQTNANVLSYMIKQYMVVFYPFNDTYGDKNFM